MDFPKPLQKIYLHYNFSKPSIFIVISISQAKQHYFNKVHLLELGKGRECERKVGYFTNVLFGYIAGVYLTYYLLVLDQMCSIISLQTFLCCPAEEKGKQAVWPSPASLVLMCNQVEAELLADTPGWEPPAAPWALAVDLRDLHAPNSATWNLRCQLAVIRQQMYFNTHVFIKGDGG